MKCEECGRIIGTEDCYDRCESCEVILCDSCVTYSSYGVAQCPTCFVDAGEFLGDDDEYEDSRDCEMVDPVNDDYPDEDL